MAVLGLNTSSQSATFFLNAANSGLNRSIARLSSGSKFAIPSESAGKGAASVVDQAVRRLGTVLEGVQAVIQLQTTADSYMTSVQDSLNTLRELADRASSVAYTAAERNAFNADFTNVLAETRQLIAEAEYAGTAVLSVVATTSVTLGAATAVYNLNTVDVVTDLAGIASSLATTAGATAAVLEVTTAQTLFNTSRGRVLGDLSALEGISAGVTQEKTGKENTYSLLYDIDFATESTQLAKRNILTQSSSAMLAQANASLQNVLSLLR